MNSAPLHVLVVDDEAPARRRIIELLEAADEIASITEARNGNEALAVIAKTRIDLVFLDVQMPEMDGLALIQAMGPERMPLTIFITAYDCHAIAAFEANALDYLLKPFSDERFETALGRARQRLEDRELRAFGNHLKRFAAEPRKPDRLVMKVSGRTIFLPTAQVDSIEAAGVYLTVYAGGSEILQRGTLADIECHLDPQKFVRIHRSTIVNIDSIQYLEPLSHGEFDVVLRGGRRKRVSRTCRARLETLLGQSL